MIYFASDMHLGLPDHQKSLKREKIIVSWLDSIKKNAEHLFLVGDIFEFWFEWKFVVPKYFLRFFGKLAELSDKGVQIHFFTGNHDIWTYDYLTKELGIKIYYKPASFNFYGKKFYIAHGDGLGPNDKTYKLMKKIFTNRFLQWSVAKFVHPDVLFRLAMVVSHKRNSCFKTPVYHGDSEWLVIHSKEVLQKNFYDFFIYGHRHIAEVHQLEKSKIIFLGDWIKKFTFASFDGKQISLEKFDF